VVFRLWKENDHPSITAGPQQPTPKLPLQGKREPTSLTPGRWGVTVWGEPLVHQPKFLLIYLPSFIGSSEMPGRGGSEGVFPFAGEGEIHKVGGKGPYSTTQEDLC